MALEITTPLLGTVKRPVKDLVISTLLYEYPLNLIKITNSVKKKYQTSVTFQGVRKAVHLLEQEKVVIKKGKEYQLNKEWILKLIDFTEELREAYFSDNQKIKEIESVGQDIKVYTFENLIDLDKFWNKVVEKWFEEDKETNDKRKKQYIQQAGHTWYVLANLQEETKILEIMKKNSIEFYTFACGNSVLDQWCKKYYHEQGFKYMNSKKKIDTSHYFGTYKDYILQTTFPKEINNEIDKIYQQTHNFESFNVTGLIRALQKKHVFKLIIMKNPLIAEQLRQSVLSHFKK